MHEKIPRSGVIDQIKKQILVTYVISVLKMIQNFKSIKMSIRDSR